MTAENMTQITDIQASTYQPHFIHSEDRIWAETNCYVDVLTELIHGLGHDPVAALAFTLGIDFEGDQWTFFKYPPEDLYKLYGFEIQELNPWRSLAHHVEQQVQLGRPVLIELDSFFLPDTIGTAYRHQHVKSTVAVNQIDIAQHKLGYFHGQSYYELQGQDFIDIFQLEGLSHDRMLPPYVEYVKRRNLTPALNQQQLFETSKSILQQHLQLIPQVSPFIAFKEKFKQDIEWLLTEDIESFHNYSFATLRQYGACFELAATYLQWLQKQGTSDLTLAINAFTQIATTAKALQFQLARAVSRKKTVNLETIDEMSQQWTDGMSLLKETFL